MEKEELYEQSIKDIFYKEEDMELARQILVLLKCEALTVIVNLNLQYTNQ